jgi:integrase-like protein
MEQQTYQGMIDYLSNLRITEHATESTQREIEKTANHYFVRNRLLYRRHHGKQLLVIPACKKQQILEAVHDHPMAGHMGVKNTFQRLSEKYYWVTMYNDIQHHIKICDIYQKRRREK